MWTRRVRGLVWVALIAYVLANQTQVAWVYQIVAALLGLLAVSWFTALRQVRGVTMARTLAAVNGRDLIAEREAILWVTVNVPRTRYMMEIMQALPGIGIGLGAARWLLVVTQPNETIQLEKRFLLRRRGIYALPPIVIASSAPLGLMTRRATSGAEARLVVYPDFLAIFRLPTGRSQPAALAALPRAGNGTDLFGTREYRTGDTLRAVHWRATARHQRLIVKEMEDPSQSSFGIALDLHSASQAGTDIHTTLEMSVKLAATFAHAASQQLLPVRLFGECAPALPDRWLRWHDCREALARVEATGDRDFESVLKAIQPLPHMVVIGPALGGSWLNVARSWAARGVVLTVVLLVPSSFVEGAASVLEEAEAQVYAAELRGEGAAVALARHSQSIASVVADLGTTNAAA